METPVSLSVRNLSHSYGEKPVLTHVSFTAAASEVICLLGPSGCGKTTLLRLIAGLERPAEGEIALAGRALTGPSAFVPPDKRGVGMMFQDYALFPHLSVLENATFARGSSAADARALLERVGLAALAQRTPHTLSAGEQQRAALVRALISRPQLMLMDEPFSNLDAGTRDEVRRLTLALLRETKTATVIVTHDPAEALMLADRIVLLHAGRVEQIGAPAELYASPRTLTAARYFSDLNEMTRDGATAYLRPHDLELTAPPTGDGGGETFRVTEVAYAGGQTWVSLARPRAGPPLKAVVRGASPVIAGDTVGVRYAPKDLIVFPSTDATSIGR